MDTLVQESAMVAIVITTSDADAASRYRVNREAGNTSAISSSLNHTFTFMLQSLYNLLWWCWPKKVGDKIAKQDYFWSSSSARRIISAADCFDTIPTTSKPRFKRFFISMPPSSCSSLRKKHFRSVLAGVLIITTGVLLCAKTKLAKTSLSAYFADGTSVLKDSSYLDFLSLSCSVCGYRKTLSSVWLKKENFNTLFRYLVQLKKENFKDLSSTRIWYILDEDEVVIKLPIGVVRYSGVANGLYVASPEGKPALSKVKVLERNIQGNCTLLEVEIQSGRPHQIRIHLSYLGHPLVGDPLYITGGLSKCLVLEAEDGSFALDGGYKRPVNPVPGDCGYHLHAHRVVMSHPTTSEMLKIIAPLPPIRRTNKESNSNLCLPPQAADSKCTF